MLVEWLVAIGTFLVAVTAVFQEHIRKLFFKPRLDIEISMTPPDCHKTRFVHINSGEETQV